MPTTIPLAVREANVEPQHGLSLATARNRDLRAVVAFAAIGLALAIGFAVFFPLAANAVALAMIVA